MLVSYDYSKVDKLAFEGFGLSMNHYYIACSGFKKAVSAIENGKKENHSIGTIWRWKNVFIDCSVVLLQVTWLKPLSSDCFKHKFRTTEVSN